MKHQKKSMEELRAFWYKVLEGRRLQIEEDLDSLTPKDRLQYIIAISSKLLPNLQSVDLSTEDGEELRVEAKLRTLVSRE